MLAFCLTLLGIFAGIVLGVVAFQTGLTPADSLFWHVVTHPRASVHDDRLFAARDVPAGKPQPWKVNLNPTLEGKIAPTLRRDWEAAGMTGLMVVQNGEIIYERYLNGRSPTTHYASFSIAKSVLSLMTGIALADGKIRSLDDHAKEYVTELTGDPRGEITIRQLLDMTSGLQAMEFDMNPLKQLRAADARLYYSRDLLKAVQQTPMSHKPGQIWSYSNGSSALLGLVLARATGEHLSTYLSRKIWKPLGAETSARWMLDHPQGMEKSAVGLYATARDYARLGQLVLQGGQWKGEQLIPADYLQQSTRPQAEEFYGYQFWVYPPAKNENGFVYRPHAAIVMEGVQGQFIYVIPELNAVILTFGQAKGWSDHEVTDINLSTIQFIARQVLSAP